jgi:ribose transport system ATP-binding protein
MYDGAIKRELIGADITERALISSALNIGVEGRKPGAPQAALS